MAKDTAASLFQGTDFQYVFHIKNEAETTAIDITGWALSWEVKRYRTDADGSAVLTKTTVVGGIVIGGTFNSAPASNLQRATVTVVDTDTTAVNPGSYRYELKRTDDGFETVLAYGRFELIRGVHR